MMVINRYERNLLKYRIKSLYDNKKEEPLPAGGSCLLGSLNLSEFVHNGVFDYDELEKATVIAINALNEVLIDGTSLHPLKEQRRSVEDWRQIGLGTMGLADALIKLKCTYGSKESLDYIHNIFYLIYYPLF